MASQPKTSPSKEAEETPDWEHILYTPERVAKWIRGEISLQELTAVSGAEMMEMAVIGFSLYEQGRYDKARVIFEALAELDPKEGYYRTALGAIYLAEEELEPAEKMFTLAIKLNDQEIASYVNRGEVYLRQGKILEAAHDFKRAIKLDPDNRDPLTRRARVLAAAALQTLEAAKVADRSEKPKKAAGTAAKKK
jgi:tetratricopeptide (TPR) repeat protein